jgi:hypothetical protein
LSLTVENRVLPRIAPITRIDGWLVPDSFQLSGLKMVWIFEKGRLDLEQVPETVHEGAMKTGKGTKIGGEVFADGSPLRNFIMLDKPTDKAGINARAAFII